MIILETHIVPAIKERIRLQEYAVSIFSSISTKSTLKKAIKRKEILLNGIPAQTSDWIEQYQKIELLQPELPAKKVYNLKLEVIFEDDFMAVINKPAGISTSGNFFRSIENALPFNLARSTEPDTLPYPMPVHRLDNPTSGLLLVAKTRNAQIILNRAFECQEIQKTYVALVSGLAPPCAVYTNEIEGKNAKSEISLIKYISKAQGEFSLLEVLPKTGRTHQIRIHLSGNGFPIVGDRDYGGFKGFNGGLYLASTGIKFLHPVSGKPMDISIPIPGKFKKFASLQMP
ncbi:RluA family pseudouridine synthase [Antarcticibacterium arcticum]|uniref:RluA family pseudouridine synthase n=1 Tax=Antarcticibacterium arcticum TaxID=2585771 RepID=A0A5B8YLD1_9FLAO|nr:RluA family pseudouridine synthase [Antarcticibacterium arcticum]QED38732.1 RluA family pseudouridine synthase [Antarcticibacterium arcticum]